MQVSIFMVCQDAAYLDSETDIQIRFTPKPIAAGSVTTMNQTHLAAPEPRSWTVVRVENYSSNASFMPVQIAYVHPSELPAPALDDWDRWHWQQAYPAEMLAIDIAATQIQESNTPLAYKFECQGAAPEVATRVHQWGITGQRRYTNWRRERVVLCAAQTPNALYSGVYLAWCNPAKIPVAA